MQGKCKVRNLKREKIITVLLLLLEHVKMVCANNLYEVSETQVSRVGSGKWKCYNTVAGAEERLEQGRLAWKWENGDDGRLQEVRKMREDGGSVATAAHYRLVYIKIAFRSLFLVRFTVLLPKTASRCAPSV